MEGKVKNDIGKIGGKIAPLLDKRLQIFKDLYEKQLKAYKHKSPITVALPNGNVYDAILWESTPHSIAEKISKSLAKSAIVAKVKYIGERHDITVTNPDEEESVESADSEYELWDMTRPLVGDCHLKILTFDDEEGKKVFWHSSSHVLGQCIETLFNANLCIGPPVKDGFFYDAYMDDKTVDNTLYENIEKVAKNVIAEKQEFQRLVLSKNEALELFADNPFKIQLIRAKIADNENTCAYRCGNLIDLCLGPHISNTSKIGAFKIIKNSSSYYLGNSNNDTLQRVYGIAFPTNKELTNYITAMEESKKYDHRILGEQQELFYFDPMSPGSAFFLPHGTIIYNKLQNFIRKEYRNLGYTEVMSPNIYNMELWEKSGHAKHYKENMFCFKIDEQEFGLKPMNCPGHCLLFKSKLHSYRDLPIRYADFGVLHRNEASGALTGLTRVRRFQQDDAHIFCRDDQIKQEILTALNFVKKVYGIFGMQFKLELSTKPAKSMGDLNIWNMAEKQMEDSLNEFAGSGNWKINPGDGAFYGPKIDIKVMDTMHRIHQTATIQLDFQLPINFDLKYKSDKDVMSRPVIIHRAVLGSTERCFAILIEHFKGKWPFFLSPRQAIVIPIASEYDEYAKSVQQKLWENEFDIEVDLDNNTLKKKIRSGEVKQFNYILVVGEKERGNNTVNIRTRDNVILGEKTIDEVISLFKTEIAENR